MVTTVEQKIKVNFEFESIKELDDVYLNLVCALVQIQKRKDTLTDETEKQRLSDVWNKLNKFAELFNSSNFYA